MKYVEITREQHDVLFELGVPLFCSVEHSEFAKRVGTKWSSRVPSGRLIKSVGYAIPDFKHYVYRFYTEVDSDD